MACGNREGNATCGYAVSPRLLREAERINKQALLTGPGPVLRPTLTEIENLCRVDRHDVRTFFSYLFMSGLQMCWVGRHWTWEMPQLSHSVTESIFGLRGAEPLTTATVNSIIDDEGFPSRR